MPSNDLISGKARGGWGGVSEVLSAPCSSLAVTDTHVGSGLPWAAAR